MVRFLCAFLVLIAALPGAVIRGTIFENRSGKPLSRVLLTLQPVAGTSGTAASLHSDRFGGFSFQSLVPGTYVLKATRRGFLPLDYGQKLWNSSGQPIILTDDSPQFLNLRMLRFGGITDTVFDENDVGQVNHEVVAYRKTEPPVLVARTYCDDHGVYRIGGLEPGIYLVRTTGLEDEGRPYVPTYTKETLVMRDSRTVQVFPDEDVGGIDIRPMVGQLLTLDVAIDPCPDPVPKKLTLAGELGRRTVQTACGFRFDSLIPGPYEVYAESEEVPGLLPVLGAYMELRLLKDSKVSLVMREVRPTVIGTSPDVKGGQVTLRRKDLAGVGPLLTLPPNTDRIMLTPSRWETILQPPSGYYVSNFYPVNRRNPRPDSWNEFLIGAYSSAVRFALTCGPAELHGLVKSSGDPVVGAPVFLEGFDPMTRQRVTELRVVRTDGHGMYRFQGLAPGTYRVLSTFEFQSPDAETMEMVAAPTLKVEAHSDQQYDLDLYGIR